MHGGDNVAVWVPLASAGIGAVAGLAGGALGAWLTNHGQAGTAKRARLADAYAAVMAAGHAIELYLGARVRRDPRLPADLRQAAIFALARAALIAPIDTHEALDDWAGRLARLQVLEEYRTNDVTANVARWERALLLMRRDLDTSSS